MLRTKQQEATENDRQTPYRRARQSVAPARAAPIRRGRRRGGAAGRSHRQRTCRAGTAAGERQGFSGFLADQDQLRRRLAGEDPEEGTGGRHVERLAVLVPRRQDERMV